MQQLAQIVFSPHRLNGFHRHRQHVTLLMYSPKYQKGVPKFSPVVTKRPNYGASCIWLSITGWISDYCCRIMTWFDLESEFSNYHFIEGKLCFKQLTLMYQNSCRAYGQKNYMEVAPRYKLLVHCLQCLHC